MSAAAPAPAPAPRERASTPERTDATARPQTTRPRGNRGGRGRGPSRSDAPRTGGPGRSMRRPGGGPSNSQTDKNKPDYFPQPADSKTVRIVPLGGVEEVGRNMFAVETEHDIFVCDAGFQFVSEGSNPGVDYILPNTRYLEKNQDKVRAVFITHGHLDHIGGIPFLMGRFGNPPIYTQNLSAVMIARRQEEYPDMEKLDIHVVEPGSVHTVGKSRVKFFPVTHSIPDSMGISIETPWGNVVTTGDLKLDHDNGIPAEHEQKKWGEIGKDNNLFFIADSTNAERDGFSIPEKRVHDTLENIVRTVQGRLIIGTFASQFERMIRIIEIAEAMGKKVVCEGRSIKTNLEIAQQTGLLTVKKETLITAQEIQDYPVDKISCA